MFDFCKSLTQEYVCPGSFIRIIITFIYFSFGSRKNDSKSMSNQISHLDADWVRNYLPLWVILWPNIYCQNICNCNPESHRDIYQFPWKNICSSAWQPRCISFFFFFFSALPLFVIWKASHPLHMFLPKFLTIIELHDKL